MKNNLAKLRKASKLTQEELGNKVGVTKYHINRIENGRTIPSVAISVRLANALDCKVEDIFLP